VNRSIAGGLSVALLMVAGCTGPRYQRPDVSVPPGYRGEELPSTDSSSSFGELRWRDLIHDEELTQLIGEALAQNFDVQIAAARVLEARAQFTISRSARLPSVDLNDGYNNLRIAENGSSSVPPGAKSDFEYTNLSTGLSWELDLWGRIRNTNRAARAALLASEETRRVVVQTLVSDVASTYFLLRDLDLELEITRRAIDLRDVSLDLVRLRVDNGYSSEIELRQAEVLVKTARTALTSLELESEQTENRLSVLLGGIPGRSPAAVRCLIRTWFRRFPPACHQRFSTAGRTFARRNSN
jgi:outer membrane protein, multidrug efflux system